MESLLLKLAIKLALVLFFSSVLQRAINKSIVNYFGFKDFTFWQAFWLTIVFACFYQINQTIEMFN